MAGGGVVRNVPAVFEWVGVGVKFLCCRNLLILLDLRNYLALVRVWHAVR